MREGTHAHGDTSAWDIADNEVEHASDIGAPTRHTPLPGVAGGTLYSDGSKWARLDIGTAHQLYKANAGATAPAYASFDWDDLAGAAGADMAHAHSAAAGEGGQIDHANLTNVTAGQHHAAITLGAGSDAALALAGQELTLADVLTPTEHTAIGSGAPHHAANHDIDGGTHTVSGRTAGQVMIATAATTFGWSGMLLSGTTGGTTNLAVSNTKTLTLTATNSYNATFPATGTLALATGIAGGQTIYGGTAANDDLTLEGTSHATKSTSYVILQPTSGNVGIMTTAPTNAFSMGGNAARTWWLERHTTANTAGNNLTIQAGGATSGATDKAGGSLILKPGQNTGAGTGTILFQTAFPKGGLSTVAIRAVGSGYTALDVLTLVYSGGASGTVRVDTVDGSGGITGITITGAGTGYIVLNGLGVTGGTGTGATIDVTAITATTDNTFATAMTISERGHIGIGTTPPTAGVMNVSNTFTDLVDVSGGLFTIQGMALLNPASASNATVYGVKCYAAAYSAQTLTGGTVGMFGQVQNFHTGSLTNSYAMNFSASNSSTGTITNLYGANISLTQGASGGLVGTMMGYNVNTTVGQSATVTNAIAFRWGSPTLSGTPAGIITNFYGIYGNASTLTGGTVNCGIWLANFTGATNNYAIVTNAGHVIFNEGGDANTDIRMEGDTNANMLFLDASADAIMFGTGTQVVGAGITLGLAVGITDAKDVILGTTTGTKWGTATSQKQAWWNATPVIQPTTAVAEAAFTENAGGAVVNVDSTFGGYTLQQIAKVLQTLGLMA